MMGRKRFVVLCLLAAICAPAFAEKETSYLAVFMDGKKIGHAVHTRSEADGEVTTSEDVTMTISRLGIPVTMQVAETSVETTSGKPLRCESVMNLGAVVMKSVGIIKEDGTAEVLSTSLGMEHKSTVRLPTGTVMAEGLRLLTLGHGLQTGTEYTTNIFNAALAQVLQAKITVGAKKEVDLLGRIVKLTEVVTILSMPGTGEVPTTSYVDDEMQTLKSIMPIAGMQVEMIDCPKEFAFGKNDAAEFINGMFVKSPEPITDVGSASSITYTFNPGKGANLVVPSTDNQQAERLLDGRTSLVVKPVTVSAGGMFPYQGTDPKVLEAVKPNRFLQSDDKRVVELARRAVGDMNDAAQAARRIESFVAQYITHKSMSVGHGTASEVLESRQGDCSEFAVLTAAMCRAVGIPAQVVVGIAYVKDFGGLEGFGGHAWVQAYVGADERGQGGKWIGLDAAFKSSGRGGYDAGHIGLAVGNGEPADFFNMAAVLALGQFKIEKLDVQRTK